ncbi:hypothetical protein DUNSADRAFT_12901 [Dunaliella salina]|uniref:Protein kinase domain-containing protein n=1 Tax=Dunaliella salina TaxID=3046 RepID=A0ABQ7H3L4_DUNSA|nr:hypothetical protein DUNSADRAFT_12901 [Dunaliella salina]|eukprot:KAF5841457.1 hypothetical protein DUNSADRAFT_12901 [Dunaliella salina]
MSCVVKEVQAGELRTLAELHRYSHRPGAEHIITCFPRWTEVQSKDQSLLPLENCDHGSLKSVLLEGYDGHHLMYEERKEILHGIVKGLALVHCLGYVHRDLKPSNVLVGSQPTASKLADFGFASKAGHNCAWQGSYGYMPPEWDEGLCTAQFSQDIFSLGILAYQLLAVHEGAHQLPHPFDSLQEHIGTRNRAYHLHNNIKKYQLTSDWCAPISTQDELAGNLVESMLQQDPCKRPTIHAVLDHPFFWTAADREHQISTFLRHGDNELLGRMFSRLAGQDQRARTLTDPGNPYLPLCIVAMEDVLNTDAKGSPFDDSPNLCTSACCQLFVSKHGDTDPGTLRGCSQCIARVDHFCNEISYHNVPIQEDPDKITLEPTGEEAWHHLQLKETLKPDYEVLMNGDIGGPGNERTVNVYTIHPGVDVSTDGRPVNRPEYVVARCWVTNFNTCHKVSNAAGTQETYNQPGSLSSDENDLQLLASRFPCGMLPADQQAFKIIPFRYTKRPPHFVDTEKYGPSLSGPDYLNTRPEASTPCPAHLRCFASLTSPLSIYEGATKRCADFHYHAPLQLCSGCANLVEHICTKHSHQGSVRLDLLEGRDDGACITILHSYNGITYSLPMIQSPEDLCRFVIVMRNDPVGPPSTSKLRRVPLPINPAQATCLFGPYCCFPLSCLMAHPVSLVKCGGLDDEACLAASLEDEMAKVHPELCPECSNLYKNAGHTSAPSDPYSSSHYCSRRNYHGFLVEVRRAQYRLWHLGERSDLLDESKSKFNVYGLIRVEENDCKELWLKRLQELQLTPEEVQEEINQREHDPPEEVCRQSGRAGNHWTNAHFQHFVGYDHLPGLLHLSTMSPLQKEEALRRNKGKQKEAAKHGVGVGFEGREEFVVAVQQCSSELGGPARARLVALPYDSRDACPMGHGCPEGLACPNSHSPAGDVNASSTPAPPLDEDVPSKWADIAKAKKRHATPQGPSGINLHDFPGLSQTAPGIATSCERHSSSNAWQCEEPGVEVTDGKQAAEGNARGAAAPLATPGSTKGRKKHQGKNFFVFCAEEEKKRKQYAQPAWGPRPR